MFFSFDIDNKEFIFNFIFCINVSTKGGFASKEPSIGLKSSLKKLPMEPNIKSVSGNALQSRTNAIQWRF